MYAIRSYYAGSQRLACDFLHQLAELGLGGTAGPQAVITSYSIHYTKLYELKLRRVYTGFAFSAVYGMLFLGLLVAVSELLWAAASLCGVAPARPVFDAATGAAGTAGLLLIGAAMAHGYTRGAGRVWINQIDVPMTTLPCELDGFRIAQVSDIHRNNFV